MYMCTCVRVSVCVRACACACVHAALRIACTRRSAARRRGCRTEGKCAVLVSTLSVPAGAPAAAVGPLQ